ncbi:MAG: Gfo/Idh/MocA family oxidoreductase, partial [Armatimonadota bacterium]|nr:Gfo/Idh/MocA family oxidoreductase [Armatimonadota bacterium]
ASAKAARQQASPNDRIGAAVIGFNGQGKSHIRQLLAQPDVDVVALCDVDEAVWGAGLKLVEDAGRPKPRTYKDLRQLLEDKDVDVVTIATPNHWHALAAIWAMMAGKDVYVEKPSSHNVWEGRRTVEIARQLGRICQVGTQIRSAEGIRQAIQYLHEGKLGKVYLARGLCYKRRDSIGKVEAPQQPPATVDYDLWLGPAPQKPVMRRRFHYDWHWQWDYGNGDLGNQGVHQMDIARWGLNKNTLPNRVLGLGGRFGYEDDGETPNTELVFLDYGDSQIIFEVRGLETPDLKGVKVGNIFYGEKGIMVIPSYTQAIVFDNDGNKVAEFNAGGDHMRNFLNAVRSRKVEDLHADIQEGYLSSALCHLGNVSYRLGELVPFEASKKAFGDNKEAYETFARFEEHLAANGIVLKETKYRLGKELRPDARTGTCGADSRANQLLTRDYRKPYVVPEKV